MGLKIKIVSGYNHDYDFNLKFIEKTYKPILGDSFYLYKYLINGIGMNYFYAEEIYNFLSISKEQFIEQRKMLEAINLIETHQNALKNKLILVINHPLNDERFFKNKLLMNILLKKTSFEYVENLKNDFIKNKTSQISAKFNEITASFNDVFANLLLDSQTKREIINPKANINLRNRIIPINNTKFSNIQNKITDPKLLQNLHYKILNENSISFYSYLIKKSGSFVYNEAVEKRVANFVFELKKTGFEEQVINLIFNYAYSTNNKIYFPYVKKIASSLLEKNILDFDSVEEHLREAFITKKRSEYGFEQSISKAEYIRLTTKTVKFVEEDIKVNTENSQKDSQIKKMLYDF